MELARQVFGGKVRKVPKQGVHLEKEPRLTNRAMLSTEYKVMQQPQTIFLIVLIVSSLVYSLHNVLFGQYLFLATERNEINTTHPNYDIIQHILIPSRSVARKTPFMQFFKKICEFHTLNFTPVSIFGIFTSVATTGE